MTQSPMTNTQLKPTLTMSTRVKTFIESQADVTHTIDEELEQLLQSLDTAPLADKIKHIYLAGSGAFHAHIFFLEDLRDLSAKLANPDYTIEEFTNDAEELLIHCAHQMDIYFQLNLKAIRKILVSIKGLDVTKYLSLLDKLLDMDEIYTNILLSVLVAPEVPASLPQILDELIALNESNALFKLLKNLADEIKVLNEALADGSLKAGTDAVPTTEGKPNSGAVQATYSSEALAALLNDKLIIDMEPEALANKAKHHINDLLRKV